MFDDGPLRDWLHDNVRAVLDQHEDMDGTPVPSLAVASEAVERSLTQLGIDWLYSSGLERKNRWGADESNRAVSQVVGVAEAVTQEAVARRWPAR
ncbi:hypothetical protein [Nocardioides sp.]|uniref:hypothetical protein n=1 Tax=Nocardioides sp. TaxID=35761 RepID=UPI003D135A41